MDNTQTQKTVQSFKITGFESTNESVTRASVAKLLAHDILGVDIGQFEDYWAGDESIDMQIFESPAGQHSAVIWDYDHLVSYGSFDIELFTKVNVVLA